MIPELLQFLRIIPDATKQSYSDIPFETLQSMTLLERVKATDWTLESITVGFTVLCVVFYFIGDWYNTSLVTSFLNGVTAVFEENFAQWGVGALAGSEKKKLYVKDSSEAFTAYATGRENIAKVDIRFKLKPRYNFFVWILEALLSYFTQSVPPPTDRVDIVITPSVQYDNFISAVVTKLGMDGLRKYNYFLSLTKTTESSELPETFVFMSESADFHKKTTTSKLINALNVQAASWLRYIAFTDQSIERPETLAECAPIRKIIISSLIITGKDELKTLSEILDAVFDVVDKFGAGEIQFDSLKKVLQTRENEVSKFKKLAQEAEAEKLADQKAEALRKEREAIRKLSPEEQERIEKKAAEKKQRKAQRKQRLRV